MATERRRLPALGVRARAAAAALLASALAFGVATVWVGRTVHDRLELRALDQAYAEVEYLSDRIPNRVNQDDYQTFSYVVIARDGRWLYSAHLNDPRKWDPAVRMAPLPPLTTKLERRASYQKVTVRYPAGEVPDPTLASLPNFPFQFVATRTPWLSTDELDAYAYGSSPPPEGLAPLPPQDLTVYVLVNPLATEQTTGTITEILGWYLAPGASVFVALIAWLATGSALRPVESIRRQMAAIQAGAFHERVPVPRSRDGIARLATTTNATLDRLEHALDEQRRLVADASHELRSPLAVLRSTLEVPLAHPDRADWPAVVAGALSDTERLQDLADDLLLLSRIERTESERGEPQATVDLHDLVAEQLAERAHTDPGLVFSSRLAPVTVPGGELLLARVVRNLLDNASRHARTEVTATLHLDGPHAVLTITDDGPGIPPGDRERVFDRFVRLDTARNRGTGGAGLGLALVRTITHALGGTARAVEPLEAPGARLVVRLPAVSPAGRP